MNEQKTASKTEKKLLASVLTAIVLAVCLCVSTFALTYEVVFVQNNLFTTGRVSINLNDGKPVIREDEFLFEPGVTVQKKFFVENNSTWDVYYKVYLDDIEGSLADILDVTIKDGDKVLYSDKASKFTRTNVLATDDALQIGERRDLTVSFYYPKEGGNIGQGKYLKFSLCADAVQTKNNPEKLFK